MSDTELREWFEGRNINQVHYSLYPGVVINDPDKFIDAHLSVLYHYGNEKWADTYRQRLKDFKILLEKDTK